MLALMLMVAVMTLGLSLGEFRAIHDDHYEIVIKSHQLEAAYVSDRAEIKRLSARLAQLEPTMRWATVHRIGGLATAIFVILVNSIVVTYFVGSSRWCKEVGEAYQLERALTDRSTILKRKTFPWAVVGMLAAVAISGLGAAADPMSNFGRQHDLSYVHLSAALFGTTVIAYVFFVAWTNISENHAVIARVLTEVKRIRVERGLDVE